MSNQNITFPLFSVPFFIHFRFVLSFGSFFVWFQKDLHDIVLRFNHAPTKGHEQDVGSKTTIRVVNSQVSFAISVAIFEKKAFSIRWINLWALMRFAGG